MGGAHEPGHPPEYRPGRSSRPRAAGRRRDLIDEVLREGHRETNAVLMGLLMCGWGLSTVHRVFNDLFLFNDE